MAFEVNVKTEDLRTHSLFVATPMYGGQCEGTYAHGIANLAALCASHGIRLKLHFMSNESLITRARNYCVDEFLRSECEHMLFIDADIGFDPNYVLLMMAMQYQYPELYDVVCAPYPKKCISWEKIKIAVEKGYADEDPNVLARFVGDYVFNPKNGTSQIPIGEPSEVLEGGTGFMMITRRVFEVYDEHFPHLKYRPDHVRSEHFDGSREIMAYFDCIIDPETKRYLSEDYMFCYNVQKMGLKVWLCPWMELNHSGKYTFGGSLKDLAMIGANPTADPTQLKKAAKALPAPTSTRNEKRISKKKK